ncbi:MAG: FIST C-terminal domain-containing protein [Paludibacter sp.]|nr:FIST C-terminal domain-containing protein [Paludibacter sp.]
MKALYSVNHQELVENLKKLEEDNAVKSILFFKTNDDSFSDEFLIPLLHSFKKPLIGGVFYELIFNSIRKNTGVLIIPLKFKLITEVFDFGLESPTNFEKLEEKFSETLPENGSVFIFTDAFTSSKSLFIEDLFNFFGFKFTFIGAGCGSDSFVSFPCVIHNSGIHANTGVIGFSEEPLKLGVAHGWTPITEPLKVTESELNKVITINWESAYDVYTRVVEQHSGLKFDDTNFLEIAKSYPIGLVKIDGEMIIRDPFLTKEGAIYCLDNIEKGQYITIMNGNINSLIEGAAKAAESCNKTDLINADDNFVFCIDCISRVKFLNEDYAKELKAIGEDLPVNGTVSFGEIANAGHSFLEIYNKTVIVATWEQTI